MKYIYKKQPIFLLIDQLLFEALEEMIKKNNEIHTQGVYKLKMDFAVYILDLISRKSSNKKSQYVYLKASYLKELQWNYNRHINILLTSNLLERIPYSKAMSTCYGYKIIYPKPNKRSRKRRFTKYNPLNLNFKRKLNEHFNSRKSRADKSTGHLTKWLNADFIQFDYNSAINYIHNSYKLSNSQLFQRRYICEMLKENLWFYSREGKDNRLHSNLTSLPSDLKPFLSNKGKKIVYLDLKSSQPFLLAGLLNLIVSKEYDKLDFIMNYMILDKNRRDKLISTASIMIPKSLETPNLKGLKEFIRLTEETDIYDYIGNQFSEEFLTGIEANNGYQDLFYSKQLGYKVKVKFSCLRDYSKKAMLEYLYCSPKSSEKRYKEIRRVFPSVLNEFVDSLKETNLKLNYSKSDFAIILQNIESYIFLDVASAEFSNKYPNTFIATIHDSLIVPIEFQDCAKMILRNTLEELFDIEPEIKTEITSTPI